MVDDQLDLGDVEAAAGHIGGDQHLGVVRLELGEGGHALLLRLHAVQRGTGYTQLPLI